MEVIVIALFVLLVIVIRVVIKYNKALFPQNNHPKPVEQTENELLKNTQVNRQIEVKEFINTLDQLGYFKWTSPKDIRNVKEHIEKSYVEENSFYTLYDTDGLSLDFRAYCLNHELINEGGAKTEFLKVARTLAKLGFVVEHIEQTLTAEYNYTLQVNDMDFDLTPTEYNSPDLDFVDFINLILERELKVEERVYAIDREDGYELIFLNDRLYRFFNQANLKKESKPFLLEGY